MIKTLWVSIRFRPLGEFFELQSQREGNCVDNIKKAKASLWWNEVKSTYCKSLDDSSEVTGPVLNLQIATVSREHLKYTKQIE